MTDPTNAFGVFSSSGRGHENHLTRALLVLLRHSPLAHGIWLRAIGLGGLGLTGVGEAQYRFQTSSLELPGLEPGQPARGISVFISREQAENLGAIAESSDKKMIPDALITYLGPDEPIIVVVESKVHAAADAIQARQINLGPYQPAWAPGEPIALRWSNLIDDLWTLIDRQIAGGTEAALMLDFFDFVDVDYRSVGPYSTLSRCRGIGERIRRRCKAILGEATGREAHGPSRGHGPYVEIEGPASLPRRVAFDLDKDAAGVHLSFWPADTPNQARVFYSDPRLVRQIVALAAEQGWRCSSNMHFGHFQAGYAWLPLPSATSIEQYLAFWQNNPQLIGTVYEPPKQPDWNRLLERLEEAEIISSRDPFDQDFVNTGRTKADVRPGIEISRWWALDKAAEMDDRGELVDRVRDAFERVLEVFER